MNYDYPIEETWTKQEIIDVVHLFTLVEKAYENHVRRDELLDAYDVFKQIVPSKMEEKLYFSAFEKTSGYSSYHAVKKARESTNDSVSMN